MPKRYFEIGRKHLIKGKYYSDIIQVLTPKKISQKKEENDVAGVYTKLKRKVKIFTAVDN